MITRIDCGCTPHYSIAIETDPNPNGNPVVWMHMIFGSRNIASIPLNKEAVDKLLVDLSQRIGDM